MTSRNTSKGFERFGLQLEIAGMVLLLIASFWQVKMSGRLDASFVEWQSQIQHDVNLSVLSLLSDIASMPANNDDPVLIKSIALSANDKANKASLRITEETNQRARELGGQAEWFSNVNLFLVCLGAILMLYGKILSLRAIQNKPD